MYIKCLVALFCIDLFICSYRFQKEFHIIFNLFPFSLSVAIFCFQFSFEVFISSEERNDENVISSEAKENDLLLVFMVYTVCSRTHKNLIFYSLRSFEFSSHRHVISIFKHSMKIHLLENFLTNMFDS